MREIVADSNLVAYCGLYCGSCRWSPEGPVSGLPRERESHLVRRAALLPGAGIRVLVVDRRDHADPNGCRRVQQRHLEGDVARSSTANRPACVLKIREVGLADYAALMAGRRLQSLPRRGGREEQETGPRGRPGCRDWNRLASGLCADRRLASRQRHPRGAGHRLEIRHEPIGLRGLLRPEVLRPAVSNRLVAAARPATRKGPWPPDDVDGIPHDDPCRRRSRRRRPPRRARRCPPPPSALSNPRGSSRLSLT